MKSILVCITAILSLQPVLAQNSLGSGSGGISVHSPSFFLDYLKDERSADLVKPDIYEGMEGSPYLSDDWLYARIKLTDNRSFDSVLVKLNLFENKVHFKDNNGRERMVAVHVKEIEIKDQSSKWNNVIFVSGYGNDLNSFFQVLADGKKAGYIKAMNIIKKEYKVFNAPVQKKFELEQGKLYLFAKGILYEESKNCSLILAAFGNDSKVNNFISTKDIKCNKEKDLQKLVDYYNSY